MPGGVLDRADFDGHADVISDPLEITYLFAVNRADYREL